MYFYLIGIDYNSAPINVRDDIYRDRKKISGYWENLYPHSAAILITCNRIEIYGVAKYADDAFGNIANFSRIFPGFLRHAYSKFGREEIFRHALRLASGLESQLKAEPQILAQLDKWILSGELPVQIRTLWDNALLLSKKIRIASGLNNSSDNIATLVFDDIEKRLRQKEKYEIIIIGTGKVAELFAKYRPAGVNLTFAAHKNYNKAQILAKNSEGKTLLLGDLKYIINGADALISATSSPHYVIKKDFFINAAAKRKQPLYIYDLAVPRDVEPGVREIDGVYLYNLDNLKYLFYRYNRLKKGHIELASDLIEDVLKVSMEASYDKNY